MLTQQLAWPQKLKRVQLSLERLSEQKETAAGGSYLDVAVYDEMLLACELVPQHIKLGAHAHDRPYPVQAPWTAQSLTCSSAGLSQQRV